MWRFLAAGSVTLGVIFGFVSSARAQSTFSYISDQSNYDVPVGGTATVDVYLQETDANPSDSVLVNENGLVGFDVNLSSNDGSTGIQSIAPSMPYSPTYYAITPNSITGGAASVGLWVADGNFSDTTGPEGALVGDTRQILLATYTISTGAAAGDETTYTIEPFQADGDFTYTNAGTDLDPDISDGSFSVTTVAISPSPSAFSLTGVLLIGVMCYPRIARAKDRISTERRPYSPVRSLSEAKSIHRLQNRR